MPFVYRGQVSLEEGTLSPESNLGRSLLAGFCERYQPDFVLHGTSDRSFLDGQLHSDLQLTLKVNSVWRLSGLTGRQCNSNNYLANNDGNQ